jgi:hypothetical protein
LLFHAIRARTSRRTRRQAFSHDTKLPILRQPFDSVSISRFLDDRESVASLIAKFGQCRYEADCGG